MNARTAKSGPETLILARAWFMEGIGLKFPYKHELKNGADFAPKRAEQNYALEKREIRSGYSGLFTKETIKQGAVVGRTGGVVVSSAEDAPPQWDYAALIGEGKFLVPEDYDRMENLCFINHSCRPNLARIGGLILVAKQHIKAGSEVTLDYAPLICGMSEYWELKCGCGHSNCRGIITTEDWKKPELAQALWSEWLPFVQRRIVANAIIR